MSSQSDQTSLDNENLCPVCFKNVDVYSVGSCDHPFCYECSTRMRVLCRQHECPICRQNMPKVVFHYEARAFKNLRIKSDPLWNSEYGIYFFDKKIQDMFFKLLEHACTKCPVTETFSTFNQLQEHVKQKHDLTYCNLCVDNLRIFTSERKCYNRHDLSLHNRKGDIDDTSHKGHPICVFCKTRHMDTDHLYRHSRREHLYCHFCDADGKCEYYPSYEYLRQHFDQEHYLCEEGDCINEKFTSVFKNEIDYNVHRTSVHGHSLTKQESKQARMVKVELCLTPRFEERTRRLGNFEEEEGAVGYNNSIYNTGSYYSGIGTSVSSTGPGFGPDGFNIRNLTPGNFSLAKCSSSGYNTGSYNNQAGSYIPGLQTEPVLTAQDFPSLGESSTAPPVRHTPRGNVTIRHFRSNPNNLSITNENFPALSTDAGSVHLSVNSSIISQDRPSTTAASKTNNTRPASTVSIHVNHRPNGPVTTHISQNTPSTSSSVQVRPRITVEDFPPLNTEPIPNAQWAPATKSKRSKDDKPNVNKVAPAPVLPINNSTIDFPVLNNTKTETKSQKSKKSSITVPISTNWVNSNNSQEQSTLTTKSTKTTTTTSSTPLSQPQTTSAAQQTQETKSKNKKKKSKSKPDSVSATNIVVDAIPAAASSSQYLNFSVSESALDKKNNKKKKDKFMKNELNIKNIDSSNKGVSSNGLGENSKNNKISKLEKEVPKQNGTVKKRSELAIECLSINDSPPCNGPKDFPPLAPVLKPPPGFSQPPPPGFTSNDLTFTNSSGQSFPILPTIQYNPPANFQTRNNKLVNVLMKNIESTDLAQFKHVSGLFRNGISTADYYFEYCRTIIQQPFEATFSELLVLLPNIEKQQELYKIYIKEYGPIDYLKTCSTCNQILMQNDYDNHVTAHASVPKTNNKQPNNSLSIWRK